MHTYLTALSDVFYNGEYKTERTGTGTKEIFGLNMRFDLRQGFPVVTTKKIYLKAIIHELLWFISGSTNVKYLQDNGITIWDEWATPAKCAKFGRPAGELGPIYGHQWRNFGATIDEKGNYNRDGIDQLKRAINQIKHNPDSRRIIVTGWNPSEVDEVDLPPCHTLFQFGTSPMPFDERVELLKMHLNSTGFGFTPDIESMSYKEIEKLELLMEKENVPTRYLDLHLFQRSADMFLGVPFNITSYALLLSMVAQVTNTVPRNFAYSITHAHIYNNHKQQVAMQLQRTPLLALPTLMLNKDIKDIDDFKFDDINIFFYQSHEAIKGEVAV